jgi:hypothetical protein
MAIIIIMIIIHLLQCQPIPYFLRAKSYYLRFYQLTKTKLELSHGRRKELGMGRIYSYSVSCELSSPHVLSQLFVT